MNYKYFYIFLQTLKMDANDASGEGLQYAQENRHQNKFPRKLWRINFGFLAQKLKILIFNENKDSWKTGTFGLKNQG